MTEIERFTARWLGVGVEHIRCPDGPWCRHSDHLAALTAELERLAEELEGRGHGVTKERRRVWREAAVHCRERAAELVDTSETPEKEETAS